MLEQLVGELEVTLDKLSPRLVFVVDFSNLRSLYSKADIREYIIPKIAKKLNSKECVVFSTSSLNLVKGDKAYDRYQTPSYKRGALNNWILKNIVFQRTAHPFQSIGIIGKNKNLIQANNPLNTSLDFWTSSVLQNMRGMGFDVVIIGCSLASSCFFVHQAEFNSNVPYRYCKWFSYKNTSGKRESARLYVVREEYSHYRGTRNKRLFSALEKLSCLKTSSIMNVISCGIYSYDDFMNRAELEIKNNEFFLWDEWV